MWLSDHGLEESDLAEWGARFDDGSLLIPVRGVDGSTLFTMRRNFNSGSKYLFEPPECRTSGVLFGLDLALESIERLDQVVVVEGASDVMASRKSGVPNSVAILGSSISAIQRAMLHALASRIIVLGDGDEAGEKLAREFASREHPGQVTTAIVRGFDPALFVARGGRVEWIVNAVEESSKDWSFAAFRSFDWTAREGVAR